jgi:hypothetical protein
MIDPRRLSIVNGIRYLEFRCAVVEEGERCPNRHLEPVMNREEINTIEALGHICTTCESKGYAWYTRLLGTTDEKGDLISSLGTDGIGAKTDEFRRAGTTKVKEQTHITSAGHSLGGAQVASDFLVDAKHKEKGNKGKEALSGWSIVKEYPEYGDILMLRNSEAKNPSSPTVERKQRTIIGLANPPKLDDPFEGVFDK